MFSGSIFHVKWLHLNDFCSIDIHLNTQSIAKSKVRKILVKNTTIIVYEINKLRQQILAVLHIKTKTKNKNKNKLESIELILKIATML